MDIIGVQKMIYEVKMANYERPRSPSSINTYLSCPYSFYLRYIYGIKFPSGDAAVFGSFIHCVNEHFWLYYNPDSDPIDALKQSISKYEGPNIQPEYEETAHTCFENFLSIVKETPRLLPSHTELRCELPTNNTVAIVDVVYPSKIVDYKTSTQYTKEAKLPNKIQAAMCSQNLLLTKGMEVRQVEFWYLRFKKYQRVTVDEKLLKEVDDILRFVNEGIEENKFPKCEDNCFFCDYKRICEAEKRGRIKSEKMMVIKNGT